jgi:hypothetical protein
MGQAIASRNTTWGNVVVKAAQSSATPACDESATANWFALELSDASRSIRLNPELVDRLEREVIDSFKSLTKRGSEVGGILLGQFGTCPQTVFVEDFDLVPCGYTRGPLYLLSDVEKRRMEAAVRARKSRLERITPVGFFRSNARTSLALEDEDVSLVDSYFAAPDSVVLLIKPFSMKPCLASFFVWDSGPGDGTPLSVQFPFKRSQLPAKQGPVVAVRRVEPPVPAFAPAQESRPSPPPVTLELPVPTPPSVAPAASKEPVVEAPPAPQASVIPVEESAAPAALAVESQPPAEPVKIGVPVIALLATPAQSEDVAPAEPVVIGATIPAPVAAPAQPVFAGAAPESRAELRASLRAVLDPAGQPNPAPPAVAAAIPRENHAAAPAAGVHESRSEFRLLRWLQFLAAGIFLFIVGAYVQYRLEARLAGPRPSGAATPSLFLQVERNRGQLYLNWDRKAPSVRAAQKASLFITDGEQTQVVPLSVDELRTGAFVYTPATSGVSFRIELANLPDGRIVSESIHSVLGRPSPLGALALPAPSPAPTQEASSTAPPPEPAATTQPPAKEEAPPAQPAPTSESSATP